MNNACNRPPAVVYRYQQFDYLDLIEPKARRSVHLSWVSGNIAALAISHGLRMSLLGAPKRPRRASFVREAAALGS
jgi:hypothetical protein